MVFSSLIFLFYFLPISLLLYYSCGKRWKNIILLLVSLFFYAWGEPVYVALILFSAVADYILGIFIGKNRSTQPTRAKFFLLLSLFLNLGVLFFFKYADFLILTLNQFLHTNLGSLNLPLPIGISFYTFQTMSYSIDVYRGKVSSQRNFVSFAMYVTLFPQLIAGPIVRYDTIQDQLENRTTSFSLFSEGVRQFIIGLGKKVLLANTMGLVWVEVHSQPISELPVATAWLGILAFAFQIYFDFSGYSDMAIGLGKMFGFDFPQNFRYPYRSRSIAEFWRRWHITLGSWFKEYVYIPLGGNRKGTRRMILNLLIVWSLTGLWHGASWNFVLWGLYFGLLIILEKLFLQNALDRTPAFFQHLYFIIMILVGWVLFFFEDVSIGLQYLAIMFGFGEAKLFDGTFFYLLLTNGILFCICIFSSLPRPPVVIRLMEKFAKITPVVLVFFYFSIFIMSTAYLVNGSYNPFLYFRF